MNRINFLLFALLTIYGCTNKIQPNQTVSDTSKEETTNLSPVKTTAPELLKYQDINDINKKLMRNDDFCYYYHIVSEIIFSYMFAAFSISNCPTK